MSNDKFGGYYSVDPLKRKVIHGVTFKHSYYMQGNTSFFIFYKGVKGYNESDPNAEIEHIDFNIGDADRLATLSIDSCLPFVQELIFTVDAELTMEEVAKYQSQGFTMDEIFVLHSKRLTFHEMLEERAAIMIPEFRGFFREQIPEYKVTEETDPETGAKYLVHNINKCSLEGI